MLPTLRSLERDLQIFYGQDRTVRRANQYVKEMSFFLRTDTEADPVVGLMNLGTKRRVVFVNGGRRQILVWTYAPDRTLHGTYSWLIPGTYIWISYVELDFIANLYTFLFFWCVSFNVFSLWLVKTLCMTWIVLNLSKFVLCCQIWSVFGECSVFT